MNQKNCVGNATIEELAHEEAQWFIEHRPSEDQTHNTRLRHLTERGVGAGISGKWLVDIANVAKYCEKDTCPETFIHVLNCVVLEEICHAIGGMTHETEQEAEQVTKVIANICAQFYEDTTPELNQ